jgi:hypothetical protein
VRVPDYEVSPEAALRELLHNIVGERVPEVNHAWIARLIIESQDSDDRMPI